MAEPSVSSCCFPSAGGACADGAGELLGKTDFVTVGNMIAKIAGGRCRRAGRLRAGAATAAIEAE